MNLDILTLLFSVFLSVFVTTNFLGTIPIFLSLTKKETKKDRRRTANIALLTATFIILGFVLFGLKIMFFLGISFDSFKVSGGIILFIVALEMIFTFQQIVEKIEKRDVAVCPLGIPLLSGAGVISLSIVFFENAEGCLEKLIVIGGILTAMLVGWFSFFSAEIVLKYLGKEGIKALEKISGIFLAAIAMEMILDVLSR